MAEEDKGSGREDTFGHGLEGDAFRLPTVPRYRKRSVLRGGVNKCFSRLLRIAPILGRERTRLASGALHNSLSTPPKRGVASPRGFEPPTYGLGSRCAGDASDREISALGIPLCSACRSACRSIDPQLADLVTAWPILPDAVRLAILALAESLE